MHTETRSRMLPVCQSDEETARRVSGDRRRNLGDAEDGPLRIALVSPPACEAPPGGHGGTAAAVAQLAMGLESVGHQVRVVTASWPETPFPIDPVWDQTVPERRGDALPLVAQTLKARRAIERLAAEGLDIVHDHTLAGTLNSAFYRRMELPVVTTVHDQVDADLARYYRELGGDVNLVAVGDRQCHLVPDLNWVGRVNYSIDVAEWPLQIRKQNYAVFLGRMNPADGSHIALRAAHAANTPLVLAGTCTEQTEKDWFRDHVLPGMRKTDQLFGQANGTNKQRLLGAARCLLVPAQLEEPFATTAMLEAMACGTPVVALNGGMASELIVDGVTGVMCNEPMDLAEAIRRSRTIDPMTCRRYVIENFNATRLAEGHTRIYRQVLAAWKSLCGAYGDRISAVGGILADVSA